MKRACQGWCGGYAPVEELRSLPPDHLERVCKDCYSEYMKRKYYDEQYLD